MFLISLISGLKESKYKSCNSEIIQLGPLEVAQTSYMVGQGLLYQFKEQEIM